MLFRSHMGELASAKRLQAAVEKVYKSKKNTTKDVGGSATTDQFTDAVISALA